MVWRHKEAKRTLERVKEEQAGVLWCSALVLLSRWWGVGLAFFKKKLFIHVMLRLYTEFQCYTIPGTGQKVCGGGWVGGGGVETNYSFKL